METKASFNHQQTWEAGVATKEKGTFALIAGGILLLALLPVLLAGCSSDGADNTYTGGDTAGVHYIDANNVDMTVTDISVAADAGGYPVVSFHVEAGGADYTALAAGDVRLYMGDLVPAGTATVDPADGVTSLGTFPSAYYERWAYERSTASSSTNITSQTAWTSFDDSDAANGNYVITMSIGFGSAEALAKAPELDTASHPQRLFMRVSGKTQADGTVTNNTVGILDFMVPANGSTATETMGDAFQYQKAYVTIGSCKKCHGPKMARAAHAGGYLDTRGCVLCHSPIGVYGDEMQTDEAYFTLIIHKLHSAIDMPAFDTRINGNGYVDVTYPQETRNCVVCHADPDNLATGSAATLDNWKDHATVEACGACHITDDYVSGINPDATSVIESHDPTAVPSYDPTADPTAPEFVADISLDPPANGQYYVAGEAPIVTVTLTDYATGTPVAGSVYTAARDNEGVVGGGLSAANLYVYGPRAWAVPVLTTGSTTDTVTPATPPTQGHSLFVGGTDANVITDATGFRYQLQAVPVGMTPGTYMVRFEGADYGGFSVEVLGDGIGNEDGVCTSGEACVEVLGDGIGNEDGVCNSGETCETSFITSTTALINFQVGTDTVEPKVAGDACLNCHGDTRMHQTGNNAHNAPFDTDHCSGCHDHSQNGGVPIANRVHAVHSANPQGDLYNYVGGVYTLNADRNWHTTLPRLDGDCSVCHVSGNDSYRNNIYGVPCLGCHGGASGLIEHMALQGFTFTGRRDYSNSTACVACHSEGESVDVSDIKGP